MIPIDPKNENQRRILSIGLSLGIQLAVGMVVFAGLGYWIDKKRGGGNAFTLIGIFLGMFYGGYEVWKLIRVLQEQDPDNEKK